MNWRTITNQSKGNNKDLVISVYWPSMSTGEADFTRYPSFSGVALALQPYLFHFAFTLEFPSIFRWISSELDLERWRRWGSVAGGGWGGDWGWWWRWRWIEGEWGKALRARRVRTRKRYRSLERARAGDRLRQHRRIASITLARSTLPPFTC